MSKKLVRINRENITIREVPRQGGAIVGIAGKGELYPLAEIDDLTGWYRIEIEGTLHTGYVSNAYTSIIEE